MKTNLFLLVPLLIALAGCATQEKYETKVKEWRGLQKSELMESWGAPDQSLKTSRGTEIIAYTHTANRKVEKLGPVDRQIPAEPFGFHSVGYFEIPQEMGGQGVPSHQKNPYPPKLLVQSCTTFFEIGSTGKIYDVDYRGNDCISN